MAKGFCGLCKQRRKLCDSHLMPEAAHGYLRYGSDGTKSDKAPFKIDDTSVRRDFRQIKKPFLCSECETRFNGGGESYVLENCFRKPGHFPLEQRLRNALNRTPWPGGWIVYAEDFPKPRLQWERLAYFAVSIFWRAGVTEWSVNNNRISVPLPSRYEQELREYLLGKPFPEQAVVSVAVTTRPDPIAHAMHTPICDEVGNYNHYRVAIPGMLFDMLIGKELPSEWRPNCVVRGHRHPIYLLAENCLFQIPVARKLRATVPSQELAREFLPTAVFNRTKHRFRK